MASARSGRQVIRIIGEGFAAFGSDEQEILEPHLAGSGLRETRLERDHVTCNERGIADSPKAGLLVDLKPDAVAEHELEALLRVALGRAGPLRRKPGSFEDIARNVVELAPRYSGSHRCTRRLERLTHERLLCSNRLADLADHE